MAKRGAEALAYRAPWESLLPQAPLPKRPRSDLQRRGPPRAAPSTGGAKRKRQEEVEEAAAAPGKRPAPCEHSHPPEEEVVLEAASTRLLPEVEVEAEAAASGRDSDENDVWHYNSFQYWRSPLPTIDLSDILDLEKDNTVEARDSSNIGLSEMET